MNGNGHTAMDICRKSLKLLGDSELVDSLEHGKVLPAKRLQERENSTKSPSQYDALMVVASLIATMAFTVALNPPGGVWQDFTTIHNTNSTYLSCNGSLQQNVDFHVQTVAGQAINADLNCYSYKIFTYSNGIAFVSSLTVILLLLSGFRYNRFFSIILTIIMWTALSSTAVTFTIGSRLLTPNYISKQLRLGSAKYFAVEGVWAILFFPALVGCILLGHAIRVINNSKLGRSIRKKLVALFRVAEPTSSLGTNSSV